MMVMMVKAEEVGFLGVVGSSWFEEWNLDYVVFGWGMIGTMHFISGLYLSLVRCWSLTSLLSSPFLLVLVPRLL